ncbi:hypothetical protein ABT010_40740 [Streptomyces sp. NPDC002668]|uniref:DUF4760 domain-containing protein n=1 Tax=Streptomyces sp. NPDC002668 TaxID=3154422 RepID=UPI00331ED7D3
MWDVVVGVNAVLSTAIVAIAATYAARQVKEARHSRAIATLLSIHGEYQSPELSRVRRRLQCDQLGDLRALIPEDRERLGNLLQKLELLAFLVNRDLVDTDDVVALFPGIPLTFSKARPYVEMRRQVHPDYARQTERLVLKYDRDVSAH